MVSMASNILTMEMNKGGFRGNDPPRHLENINKFKQIYYKIKMSKTQ